jgi:hypothetical protein
VTRVAHWTETSAGAQTGTPTFTLAHTTVTVAAGAYYWHLAVPYTAGTLTLPALPPSFAANSVATATTAPSGSAVLVRLPAGGWDAFRPVAFDRTFDAALAVPGPAVVTASTVGGVP